VPNINKRSLLFSDKGRLLTLVRPHMIGL